jgi:uncharacterized protein with HEPN domain
MNTGFLDYVEDIIDAMNKAEIAIQGLDFETFEEDFIINFAVARALEIVGEATKRLPDTLRESYPNIPWRDMAGMRDRLIHAYDSVDMQIMWRVVTEDIPFIKPQLQQILADYSAKDP